MTISATVVRNPRRARVCAAAEAARHIDRKIDRALKMYATNQEQTR